MAVLQSDDLQRLYGFVERNCFAKQGSPVEFSQFILLELLEMLIIQAWHALWSGFEALV